MIERIRESEEEGRALLQSRVALLWKVMFFVSLLSSIMGAIGAIAAPGLDLVLVLALTLQTATCWWVCLRGQRSVRFLRVLEVGGLFLNLTGGALVGRFLLAQFLTEHDIATREGALMADGYVAMMLHGGTALMIAIRAALIPSTPRRTIFVTALVGAPMLLISTIVVPVTHRGLAWRAPGSGAFPWMPGTAAMLWGFVVITCAVISHVIYGLRVEVRAARRLGQYILERKIGEGGMGEVYLARHGMMRRPSALKLLPSSRAGEVGVQRFEREVQLTARLTHTNTITIFDYGRTHDGVFYYAMELLDGATLQRIVAVDGAQPAGRVIRILAMACGALTEAHGIGLIHRDIKPANIMLCTKGGERDVVKLLDFGLVKELAVDQDVKLTGSTSLTGTPQYMAPECILEPDSVDARTDIYALGAVGYYLLAGGEVFGGKSIVEVFSQHLHQAPESLRTRGVDVPAELEALMMSCLDKDPSRRPQTTADLRRRLEACVVDRWDSAQADAWWRTHQPRLEQGDADLAPSTHPHRTLAVDEAARLS